MSFLVFSFYRGGGTPQTPSIIINIAPLGVRNFAQKFQKSPGYGLWLQVIQSLLMFPVKMISATPSEAAWPPTPALPLSSESPDPHRQAWRWCPPRWKPSSSGASAESENTRWTFGNSFLIIVSQPASMNQCENGDLWKYFALKHFIPSLWSMIIVQDVCLFKWRAFKRSNQL